MKRDDLKQAALDAATRCMGRKRFIALVDVFLEMGKLTQAAHQDWRLGRVAYLEKVIQLNLSLINVVCLAIHASARQGKLKASWTSYVKWGKGARTPLRFTKSGAPELERRWATHYLHPQLSGETSPNLSESTDRRSPASGPQQPEADLP